MSERICPICSGPVHPEMRPFCSRRCADLDLAKWLGGGYALPSQDPDDQQAALDQLASGTGDTDPSEPRH